MTLAGRMIVVEPLLSEILSTLCRLEDTPLAFEDGAETFARSIVRRWRDAAGPPAEGLDWPSACAAIEERIGRALSRGEPLRGGPASLVKWIDLRRRLLADVHPRAATVLRMTVEGLDAREIAGGLGLGPALVLRILRDIREVWVRC